MVDGGRLPPSSGYRPEFQPSAECVGGRSIEFRMACDQRGTKLAEGAAEGEAYEADDSED
jgi:hypothetical protein